MINNISNQQEKKQQSILCIYPIDYSLEIKKTLKIQKQMMKSIKKNMDIFEFKKRKVKQVIRWGKKKER